ncbi:MAG: rhodanese-like domain-containing protein [Gammaproteobacteria bacterium]|nr:rhodanese-like domain-containing protein [Gammaproteobacteria bacterium]
MDQLIVFVDAHWILVTAFLVVLSLAVRYEISRGGTGISPQELTNMVNNDEAVVLDVRDAKEYKAGHITNSISIPNTKLVDRITELDKYKDKGIIITCAAGQHSGSAGRQLRAAGHEKIYRLEGGISTWRGESLPLVK